MRLRLALVAAAMCGLLSACGGSGTTITAQFPDAAGLFVGNDVGVLGVKVGEVESVTPRGDHVDVVLTVDSGVQVPADAGAVIVSRSVATDRYVELTPVYSSGPVMADGTVLNMDRTRAPVEFDDLLGALRTISDDLAGGEAKPLNRALRTVARAADGHGELVAGALADLATTLEAADDSSDDFTATVRNLDDLTTALAENDALVRRFTRDVAEATDLLNDETGSTEAAVKALAEMLRRVADFVHEHRDEMTAQVADISRVTRALNDDEGNLAELLETMPLMLQNGARAVDENNHLNFLTRPGDFAPTEAGFSMLCAHFPPEACAPLQPGAATLFDIFRQLAGVQ